MSFNIPHADPAESKISIDNQPIEHVQDFKYHDVFIDRRHQAQKGAGLGFWKFDRIWKASHIFKTAVLTILTNGFECWIIRPSEENNINAFAMNCYRIILGVKRLDRITNIEIYRRTAQEPLMPTIRARQLRWIGHLLRRAKNEPARELALYEPRPRLGNSKQGPNITYKHQIASLLTTQPELMTIETLETRAANRDNWREYCHRMLN